MWISILAIGSQSSCKIFAKHLALACWVIYRSPFWHHRVSLLFEFRIIPLRRCRTFNITNIHRIVDNSSWRHVQWTACVYVIGSIFCGHRWTTMDYNWYLMWRWSQIYWLVLNDFSIAFGKRGKYEGKKKKLKKKEKKWKRKKNENSKANRLLCS